VDVAGVPAVVVKESKEKDLVVELPVSSLLSSVVLEY
jgi:hypothetical protein